MRDVVGATAAEVWSRRPIGTLPGPDAVDRLCELTGRLLAAGRATGGPAFAAMAPPFEEGGDSVPQVLMSRLGALRHHRADAHRAAWAAAGLTAEQVRREPPRPAVEADTDRRDEPVYAALSPSERWEFLAVLGALPDGLGS